MKRNRHFGECFESLVGINAERGVTFLGEAVSLLD
jgi:hypothetical protein